MMNEDHLLDGEYVIQQSVRPRLVLTNKRLKHIFWSNGKIQMKSILLNKIDHMEVRRTHDIRLVPVLLILIFSIILLMMVRIPPTRVYMSLLFVCIAVGGILLIYCLSTVSNRLILMTRSGKSIKIRTGRITNQDIFDFVNTIEEVMEKQS